MNERNLERIHDFISTEIKTRNLVAQSFHPVSFFISKEFYGLSYFKKNFFELRFIDFSIFLKNRVPLTHKRATPFQPPK